MEKLAGGADAFAGKWQDVAKAIATHDKPGFTTVPLQSYLGGIFRENAPKVAGEEQSFERWVMVLKSMAGQSDWNTTTEGFMRSSPKVLAEFKSAKERELALEIVLPLAGSENSIWTLEALKTIVAKLDAVEDGARNSYLEALKKTSALKGPDHLIDLMRE